MLKKNVRKNKKNEVKDITEGIPVFSLLLRLYFHLRIIIKS